jgi:hypothetical protein
MLDFEYWVEYGGQPTDGFTHIGVDDPESIMEIGDIESQVNELHRLYGELAPIRIYAKERPKQCIAF